MVAVRRSEDDNDRRANGGRDVCDARIVTDKQSGTGYQRGKFRKSQIRQNLNRHARKRPELRQCSGIGLRPDRNSC